MTIRFATDVEEISEICKQKVEIVCLEYRELRDNSILTSYKDLPMAYRIFEQSEEVQREELLRKITDSVKNLSLRELEALYYELRTKNYINE